MQLLKRKVTNPHKAIPKPGNVPDKSVEVNIEVGRPRQPLSHAHRGVRPHAALVVEQEHPYDVALRLNRQFGPNAGWIKVS